VAACENFAKVNKLTNSIVLRNTLIGYSRRYRPEKKTSKVIQTSPHKIQGRYLKHRRRIAVIQLASRAHVGTAGAKRIAARATYITGEVSGMRPLRGLSGS